MYSQEEIELITNIKEGDPRLEVYLEYVRPLANSIVYLTQIRTESDLEVMAIVAIFIVAVEIGLSNSGLPIDEINRIVGLFKQAVYQIHKDKAV
jgi:hypothetical protein